MEAPQQTETDREVAQVVGYTGSDPFRPSSDLNDAFHALDLLGEEWSIVSKKAPLPGSEKTVPRIEFCLGERPNLVRNQRYPDFDMVRARAFHVRQALAGVICDGIVFWKNRVDAETRELAEATARGGELVEGMSLPVPTKAKVFAYLAARGWRVDEYRYPDGIQRIWRADHYEVKLSVPLSPRGFAHLLRSLATLENRDAEAILSDMWTLLETPTP